MTSTACTCAFGPDRNATRFARWRTCSRSARVAGGAIHQERRRHRELPLALEVVAAIGRQLPPGADPGDLVFTGPGGGVVTRGTRTVLSRHNFRRTYHSALAKLADPTTELRPTAARVLKALRSDSPRTAEELAVALAKQGRAIRPTTIQTALGELAAAHLVAADGVGQDRRWSPLAPPRDPLLDAGGPPRRTRLPAHLRDLARGRRDPGAGD